MRCYPRKVGDTFSVCGGLDIRTRGFGTTASVKDGTTRMETDDNKKYVTTRGK